VKGYITCQKSKEREKSAHGGDDAKTGACVEDIRKCLAEVVRLQAIAQRVEVVIKAG